MKSLLTTQLEQKRLQGVGIGLRPVHLQEVIATLPEVNWWEVHIDNFLAKGINQQHLEQIRCHYPLSFHGVGLNLGGVDPLDSEYLDLLRRAIDDFAPALVSEHLCFTRNEHYFHDLLPIPYTRQALNHIADRVTHTQERLGRPIAIENISRYYHYPESEFTEAEFLNQLCRSTDCKIVLDLNNLYVNQCNFNEDARTFFNSLSIDNISEIHLAGFSIADHDNQPRLIDTHSAPVAKEVWQLYKDWLQQYGEQGDKIPCLIEWDNQMPSLDRLISEAEVAKTIRQEQRSTIKPTGITDYA